MKKEIFYFLHWLKLTYLKRNWGKIITEFIQTSFLNLEIVGGQKCSRLGNLGFIQESACLYIHKFTGCYIVFIVCSSSFSICFCMI